MAQRKGPRFTGATACVDLMLHSQGLESPNLLFQSVGVKLKKLCNPLETLDETPGNITYYYTIDTCVVKLVRKNSGLQNYTQQRNSQGRLPLALQLLSPHVCQVQTRRTMQRCCNREILFGRLGEKA